MATTFLVPKNNARSRLLTASLISAATITLPSGDGSKFPTTYPYNISIELEILQVSNNASDVLTVTHAQEGTSDSAHPINSRVALLVTAKAISDLNTAVNALEADSGGTLWVATGDVLYAASAGVGATLTIGATDTIMSVQGGIPTWRTPANILTDLTGQASATFDWNSQTLSGIGAIDAGSGSLTINTTGAFVGLIVEGSNSADGPLIKFNHSHTTPDLDAFIGQIDFAGFDGNGSPAAFRYGAISVIANNVTDTSESGKFRFIGATGGSADNIAAELTGAGALNLDSVLQAGAAMAATVTYNRFGAATTDNSLSSDDDLMVSGKLEVDGISYFDATTWHQGGLIVVLSTGNNSDVRFDSSIGIHANIGARWDTDQFIISIDEEVGTQVIIGEILNRLKNYDHADQSTPTLYIQSSTDPDSANDEWISFTHNVTDAVIALGSGALLIQPNGDTDDYFSFETLSNVPTIKAVGSYLRIGDVTTSSQSLASEADLMVSGKLEVDGVAYLEGQVMGGGQALVDYIQNYFGGNFTSGGGATVASKFGVVGTLTGANGDTGAIRYVSVQPTIVTQDNSETIARVVTLDLAEPNITLGTDTATIAATLYIQGAPTEGVTNAAIYIVSGDTNLSTVTLRGKLTAGANEIEGDTFDINGGTIDGATITSPALSGTTTGTFTVGGTVTINAFTLGGKLTATGVEIEGDTFDINGGTIDGVTITSPALSGTTTGTFTIGGTVSIDVGSGSLALATGSSTSGLIITTTNDGHGVLYEGYHITDNPGVTDSVLALRSYGRDEGDNKVMYGLFLLTSTAVGDGIASGTWDWWLLNAGTNNVAMSLSSAGALNLDSVLQAGAAMAATVAYNRFGATATGHALASDDDLMVSGKLEVDGEAFFDGKLTITGVASNDRLLAMSNWSTPWVDADADNKTYYGINNSASLYKTASDYTGTIYGYIQYVNAYYANDQDWTNSLAIEGIASEIVTRTSTEGTITGAACFTAKLNQQVGGTPAGMLVTNYYGYYMKNQIGSAVTNQYGVYIEDLTRGTNNYGIYIAGASTAAIVVASADPVQLGVAGSSTGTMNWQGATSGVVTMTVAAAAGTWTMTLPTAVGGAGEQLTDAAGNGVTSWAAAASLREYKDNIVEANPREALDTILNTKAYHFNYKEGLGTQDPLTNYVGVMADEASWAMHYSGRIVNPVNTLGYMVLGFQAIDEKIETVNDKIERLESELVELKESL